MAKTSKIKVKKKRWFPILAPSFLGQKEIGESYLNEGEAAAGRRLKINLRDLTGSIRDQNIYVSLKIKGGSGNNLQTEAAGYAYMPFYIKKLARKNAGWIDDSFVLKTKDNKTVRLKPLVITVFSIKKSVKTVIRKKLKELMKEEVGKLSFESLITDLLRYRLQMEFKKKLNKVCPIREVMMRKVELEEEKRAGVMKEIKKEEGAKEEKVKGEEVKKIKVVKEEEKVKGEEVKEEKVVKEEIKPAEKLGEVLPEKPLEEVVPPKKPSPSLEEGKEAGKVVEEEK